MTKPAQPGHRADAAAALALTLYERSGAAAYGVSAERFRAILDEILRKHFFQSSPHQSSPYGAQPSPQASAEQKADFCAGLRLEELALAHACAAELADSLFADLYGVNAREGVRKSKLLSYTGRGSLEGWLRTVMAQEFI